MGFSLPRLGLSSSPLEVDDNVEHSHDNPEVAGHGLLRYDELDALLLDIEALSVNLAVVRNYLLCQLQISVFEGIHGAINGFFNHAAQDQNLALKLMKM